jgi:predicted nucleic acid-binding protein
MIMVDTSVWIDYVNGVITPHTDALDKELENGSVVTGDLIITEFLQGFRTKKDYEAAKRMMNSLTCFEIAGKEQAILSAKNYRYLTSKGITDSKTIDVLIATFCIEYSLTLLHNGRDFLPIEKYLGLKSYTLSE